LNHLNDGACFISDCQQSGLLHIVATHLVSDFNVINRRSKAIETVEREEIYHELFEVLNPLEQKLGEQGTFLVDMPRLYQVSTSYANSELSR